MLKVVMKLEASTRGKRAVKISDDEFVIFSDKDYNTVMRQYPTQERWVKLYGTQGRHGWAPEYREPYTGGTGA